MKRTLPVISVLLIVLGCGAGWAETPPSAFSRNCAACHGMDGRGKTRSAKFAVPDFRSKQVREMTDGELFESIALGTKHKSYPHAFQLRGMKVQEIDEIVKYIRALQAER